MSAREVLLGPQNSGKNRWNLWRTAEGPIPELLRYIEDFIKVSVDYDILVRATRDNMRVGF